MSCIQCHDHGLILARLKEEPLSSAYPFRCGCSKGQARRESAIPYWTATQERHFVSESQDDAPTDAWIIEQFEKGLTGSDEFKRRVKLWGRERFVKVWEMYRKKKLEERASDLPVEGVE